MLLKANCFDFTFNHRTAFSHSHHPNTTRMCVLEFQQASMENTVWNDNVWVCAPCLDKQVLRSGVKESRCDNTAGTTFVAC